MKRRAMDSERNSREASETDETGAAMRGVRFVIEYGPDTGLAVMPRAVNGHVPQQGGGRMSAMTAGEIAQMRLEKEQGPAMETERADHQIRIVSDVGIAERGSATASIERVPQGQQTARPMSAIDATVGSREVDWFTLLQAARSRRPTRLLYCLIFKRWLDLLIASLLLIALAPVLLLIACVTWLDMRGAIIYRQRRVGRYGNIFTMYKFCTMIPDRRHTRQSYGGPERRKAHKTATDPRVTRTGKFMRRTSLDELPQLFNVLRGEMSIVGPRPELPEIVGRYESWQHQRHLVLPGITGWWQTHGRSGLMMHEHTELDIYYVENISFGMDVRILLGTVRALASRAGAF
jgi:lipopolysaccharide/colanic/teichoic acid biosynthesis glycosyltransferase